MANQGLTAGGQGGPTTNLERLFQRVERLLDDYEKQADNLINDLAGEKRLDLAKKVYGVISSVDCQPQNDKSYTITTQYKQLQQQTKDKHLQLGFGDKDKKLDKIKAAKPSASISSITAGRSTDTKQFELTVTYDTANGARKGGNTEKTVIKGPDGWQCKGPAGTDNFVNYGDEYKKNAWKGVPDGSSWSFYGSNENLALASFSSVAAKASFKGFSGSISVADVGVKGISLSAKLAQFCYDFIYSAIIVWSMKATACEVTTIGTTTEVRVSDAEGSGAKNAVATISMENGANGVERALLASGCAVKLHN